MNTDESHIVTRSRRPALLDISNREANMNLDNGLDKTGRVTKSSQDIQHPRGLKDNITTCDVSSTTRTRNLDESTNSVEMQILDLKGSSKTHLENSEERRSSKRTLEDGHDSLPNKNVRLESATSARISSVPPVSTSHVPGVGGVATNPIIIKFTSFECVKPVIKRSFSLHKKNADPSACLEVIEPLFNYYLEQENIYAVRPYMSRQRDINPKMRSILIDWLIEVHYKFKLEPLVIWNTVNIIDRYLRDTETSRSRLQLVGIASLLIASKLEESIPPTIQECVYITDNAYQRDELLQMEFSILEKLNYFVTAPTGYHFLFHYLSVIRASSKLSNLAFYYAERNLQEYDSLYYPPHVIAAAALYAALLQQNLSIPALRSVPVWNRTLREETGITEEQVIPCAAQLIRHCGEESETASGRKLVAAKRKYSSEYFMAVTSLPLPVVRFQ